MDEVQPCVRTLLELDLRRLAEAGHMPTVGERHIEIRIDDSGHLRWFEARRIRIPASELELVREGTGPTCR